MKLTDEPLVLKIQTTNGAPTEFITVIASSLSSSEPVPAPLELVTILAKGASKIGSGSLSSTTLIEFREMENFSLVLLKFF